MERRTAFLLALVALLLLFLAAALRGVGTADSKPPVVATPPPTAPVLSISPPPPPPPPRPPRPPRPPDSVVDIDAYGWRSRLGDLANMAKKDEVWLVSRRSVEEAGQDIDNFTASSFQWTVEEDPLPGAAPPVEWRLARVPIPRQRVWMALIMVQFPQRCYPPGVAPRFSSRHGGKKMKGSGLASSPAFTKHRWRPLFNLFQEGFFVFAARSSHYLQRAVCAQQSAHLYHLNADQPWLYAVLPPAPNGTARYVCPQKDWRCFFLPHTSCECDVGVDLPCAPMPTPLLMKSGRLSLRDCAKMDPFEGLDPVESAVLGAHTMAFMIRQQMWVRQAVAARERQLLEKWGGLGDREGFGRGPCAVIHVRRGDRRLSYHPRPGYVYHPSDPQEFVAKARNFSALPPGGDILVMSDDAEVITTLRASGGNRFLALDRKRHTGEQPNGAHLPSGDGREELLLILLLIRLVNRCRAGFVASHSSGFSVNLHRLQCGGQWNCTPFDDVRPERPAPPPPAAVRLSKPL
eukprot:TRINITY_DN7424_c0_g7_i1.p1 TRINITY_DN7424_c0_g7~~TRINITY_DN7424_c0_g7_i1.p1  ORF type:complete len:518 (+),score=74.81 TRINITY_DN7424_c0_g7_i1:92-1645(+)